MNFKGGAFSAGSDRICDACFKDGRIYFLQESGAAFDLRYFDTGAKKFALAQKNASFADKCFFSGGELLELFGMIFAD